MGMLSRMSTIVKSKMNRILDNAEDPEKRWTIHMRNSWKCCAT